MAKDNVTGKDKEFYDLGKKMFDRIKPVTTTKAPPKNEVTALKEYIAHLESALESSLALNKAQAKRDVTNTNEYLCSMLRQVHDVLAVSSLPPKSKWVGLTDEEVEECWDNLIATPDFSRKTVYEAIESKLKEKNGG